ncbi:intraflagellar transport protein 88 homolog [Oppia nitens]|uniref:intraflagellar transport protein 88 homolog n=1 Tax=Oppia nitens TaxID=1686743 RepID=UPI0023DC898B|nr:intraflagellar transport protein 88 homolog [Oppia nitens]
MMEKVILADSDDDLYEGYNEFHPALDTRNLQNDEGFQQAVLKSSYGRKGVNTGYKTAAASRMGTNTGFRRSSITATANQRRITGTAVQAQPPSTARPMTAVRGVGYTSQGNRGATMFDPLGQAKSMVSGFQTKDDSLPEVKIKQLEKKINDLLEESVFAAQRLEISLALEKAKECVQKERSLSRMKEQSGLAETIAPNSDLTFAVLFNLALQYTNSDMYSEAINTYQSIIKNRTFTNTGRLKLNIGNIYYKQSNYPKAIKFYRMALDQIPNIQKDLRLKIMQNIGLSFVRLNQFADSITSFEYIMSERIDAVTAFHLIVCNYGLGDKQQMKQCFSKLLEVNIDDTFDDKYTVHTDLGEDLTNHMLVEVIKNDDLRKLEKKKRHDIEWSILTGAKLIAPVIGDTFSQGYEWCVEQIRNSSYSHLANDLEINKAVKHLRKREFNEAISTLKSFEKRDNKSASTAATNLSFLYLLQNDISMAEKYANEAINANRYNSGALVNRGNAYYKHQDYERAKEYYKEAVNNDSQCLESMYNLSLAFKKLGSYEDALDYLFKLHTLTKRHPHIIYQIANIYELLENKDQALDFYQQLLHFVPSDPSLLVKLSDMCDSEGDKQQAFSYLTDSYRYFPSHIPTIERLAAHYLENKIYEKAIKYLERAALVQPKQIKWLLMVGACHRRSGNYQNAYNCYKTIHNQFPENIECLKFLIRVSTDLGLKESYEYSDKLKKLEKNKEIKEQRVVSGLNGTNGIISRSTSRASQRRSATSSREGSASSSSSGYLTSASPRSTASKSNSQKREVDNNNKNLIDMSVYETLNVTNERPTTSWKRNAIRDEDDFQNDDIVDILPD